MRPENLVEELRRRQAEMYAGGSFDRVKELLADAIVWHVPGSSPIAGEHRRHDGVIEYFETRRRLASNSMKLQPGDLLADDDCVVQRVDGTAVWSSSIGSGKQPPEVELRRTVGLMTA